MLGKQGLGNESIASRIEAVAQGVAAIARARTARLARDSNHGYGTVSRYGAAADRDDMFSIIRGTNEVSGPVGLIRTVPRGTVEVTPR